jgi:hypothetical protein
MRDNDAECSRRAPDAAGVDNKCLQALALANRAFQRLWIQAPAIVGSRIGGAEALRGLTDAIVFIPEDRTLTIELQATGGDVEGCAGENGNGGMLAPLGRWRDERSPETDDLVQIMLVGGARSPLNLEFSWAGA